MFSRRTRWDLTVNRLAALRDAKRAAGSALLDLTVSNPTQVGLEHDSELLAWLGGREGALYEPEPRGLASAREAVAADYRRRGCLVDPDRIVLTASSSEAYAFLFKLLCDPGDRVAAPRPSYPLFEYLAGLESVAVDSYPLAYDGEWHLSAEAVERALRPNTRAVVVVSPNNPTGSFLKRDEAAALQQLAARRELALISDEVFADYAFAPDPRREPTLARDGAALGFSLGGLSKSCGLPQLKLGWIAVSGPAPLREQGLARLEVVADTYLSVSTPVQRALPRLLERLPALQAPIRARVETNRATLARALAGGSAATLLRLEGGWSAVLRVPATRSEEDWALTLLQQDHVVVHPGFFFDFEHEAFLVLSLLAQPDVFDDGVRRVVNRVLDAL